MWILLGIIAALCWGIYPALMKIANRKNSTTKIIMIGMAVGAAVISLGSANISAIALIPSIITGLVWASGMFFAQKAISLGADISRLTPLYNTNTFVAVFIGVLFLGELPASIPDLIRLLLGAALIVLGGIAVTHSPKKVSTNTNYSWILLGILAALCWGIYPALMKEATISGATTGNIFLGMMIGALLLFTISPKEKRGRVSFQTIIWSLLAGLVWAGGMFFAQKAISLGADIARLTPLYNTNTLIAVIIGFVVLKEWPKNQKQKFLIIAGAMLVVLGASLVV